MRQKNTIPKNTLETKQLELTFALSSAHSTIILNILKTSRQALLFNTKCNE